MLKKHEWAAKYLRNPHCPKTGLKVSNVEKVRNHRHNFFLFVFRWFSHGSLKRLLFINNSPTGVTFSNTFSASFDVADYTIATTPRTHQASRVMHVMRVVALIGNSRQTRFVQWYKP